jgi:hypothetical protein
LFTNTLYIPEVISSTQINVLQCVQVCQGQRLFGGGMGPLTLQAAPADPTGMVFGNNLLIMKFNQAADCIEGSFNILNTKGVSVGTTVNFEGNGMACLYNLCEDQAIVIAVDPTPTLPPVFDFSQQCLNEITADASNQVRTAFLFRS